MPIYVNNFLGKDMPLFSLTKEISKYLFKVCLNSCQLVKCNQRAYHCNQRTPFGISHIIYLLIEHTAN